MAKLQNNSGFDDEPEVVEAEILGKGEPTYDDKFVGYVSLKNKRTGEIEEREYNSATDVLKLYQELDAEVKAREGAVRRLKNLLGDFMSAYSEYEFPDGTKVKWVSRSSKEFDFAKLSQVMDADTLALFVKIPITALTEYVNESLQNGHMTYEERDEILHTATVTEGTPFLKIG